MAFKLLESIIYFTRSGVGSRSGNAIISDASIIVTGYMRPEIKPARWQNGKGQKKLPPSDPKSNTGFPAGTLPSKSRKGRSAAAKYL